MEYQEWIEREARNAEAEQKARRQAEQGEPDEATMQMVREINGDATSQELRAPGVRDA